MPDCIFLTQGRSIRSCWGEDGQTGASVGHKIGGEEITRIEVYHVAGQCGHIPWFGAWGEDRMLAAYNAAHMTEVVFG